MGKFVSVRVDSLYCPFSGGEDVQEITGYIVANVYQTRPNGMQELVQENVIWRQTNELKIHVGNAILINKSETAVIFGGQFMRIYGRIEEKDTPPWDPDDLMANIDKIMLAYDEIPYDHMVRTLTFKERAQGPVGEYQTISAKISISAGRLPPP